MINCPSAPQRDLTTSPALEASEFKAPAGLFGAFYPSGPYSLPSWAPGKIVGTHGGWPVNPIGAKAFATR